MTLETKLLLQRGVYAACALVCLLPFTDASVALVGGIALALAMGNPFRDATTKLAPRLLAVAIVGLGAGMNLNLVGMVGLHGIGYTAIGITLTMAAGWALGRWLKTDADTSLLVAVGTAICGGSAIAAVAVAIRAKASEVSVALVTVFLLNALAILIFPRIGHLLNLSQTQFGLWSALAIHDTSSVVGAAMEYGAEALQIGTTVKLARALWIIPVSFAIGHYRAKKLQKSGVDAAPIKRPYFIFGFLATAALVTWVPVLQPAGLWTAVAARRLLVATLFLIGSNMTLDRLKQVGARPFIQGVLLWLAMGSLTLVAILQGIIGL